MNWRCITIIILAPILLLLAISASEPAEVRGFFITAPKSGSIDRFIRFIEEELAPRSVTHLVLRIDYHYDYQSHPELAAEGALTEGEAHQIALACRSANIQLVPQINLLGHQSWANKVNKLLEVYPQFDETSHVKMPETYKWPNDDGLYCKSYCPLHPDVHDIVFALIDEIVIAFEADTFHAGMDEVFYIGDPQCPRCSGKDRSVLFADEVERIRDHLAKEGRKLWIWGDRLLDGNETGLGEWEAAINGTHQAIDLISKDIVICDWHYERAESTAAYFAMKGFEVITCTWNKPEVAVAQVDGYRYFRNNANPTLATRYRGVMQTVWSGNKEFLDQFYGEAVTDLKRQGQVDCFHALFNALKEN